MEEWTCANPSCRFVLVMGLLRTIPHNCPKCNGQAWDIKGDLGYCRVRGIDGHVWKKGIDENGIPHLDIDQHCEACGAVLVVEGIVQ